MLGYLQPIVTYIGDHQHAALAIVFLFSMGEALFVLGLFVPSTVVLVGAGTLIGMGKLSFIPIFSATVLGAVAGDAISYWIGHTYREEIRQVWPFNRYTGMLDKGEAYFARHGGKSVFIGRFIPGIKSVVPGIAGIVGMNPVRFTVINVVSAIAWAASHLLPGIGIGRGIDVANSGNPRLLELLLLSLFVAVATWYATKFAFIWLLPHAEKWRWRLATSLSNRGDSGSRFLHRLIANEKNILVPFSFFALALFGLSGFMMVAAEYLADPAFVRSDEAISAYLQGLRTPVFDSLMVSVTMLGDGVVLAPAAVAIVAILLWHKRWRLASTVATGFVSAALFVPLVKTIIHRARPISLYSGADGYSFPSGHATLSATIIGICALIVAQDFAPRIRHVIYVVAAITIGLIAFSRLYLFAHWPSDVAAGLLFGGSLVFVLAWLLHGKSLTPASKQGAMLVAVTLAIAYPYHLSVGYSVASANYKIRETQTIVAKRQWLANTGMILPQRRTLLDGEFGEPFIIQTDLDLAAVRVRLAASGWKQQIAGRLASLVDAILPSRAPLPAVSVLPLTNNGRPPIAVFTRGNAALTGNRDVLRVWSSGSVVSSVGNERPLLLISATSEMLDPIAFGYAVAEEVPMSIAQNDTLARETANGLQGSVTELPAGNSKLYLVSTRK